MVYFSAAIANFSDPVMFLLCGISALACSSVFQKSTLGFVLGLFCLWGFVSITKPVIGDKIVDHLTIPSPAAHEIQPGYDPWNDIKGTPFEEYSELFAVSMSSQQTNDLKRWIARTKIRRTRDCQILMKAADSRASCLSIRTLGSANRCEYLDDRVRHILLRTKAETTIASAGIRNYGDSLKLR